MDYVTDSRDKEYWRAYVGQTSSLAERIPQHCRAIQKGKLSSLHYWMICDPTARGYRFANFIRLWSFQVTFPQNTDKDVVNGFENILETCFTCVFQTLSPSILDLFGLRPEGNCSNVGLNIVPPLVQGIELAPTVRGDFTKYLEASDDPEIRDYNQNRSVGKKKENVPWTPYREDQGSIVLQDWLRQVSNSILESNICKSGDLAIPFGTTKASVGIVFDSIPCHVDGGKAPVPFGLKITGFTESNSLIWASNLQRYRVVLDTFIDSKIWLRLGVSGDTIERMFVRSPAPLVRMWASKGLAAQELGALFRFVNSIIGLKLFPAFYQSTLTLLLIIRGWDDGRSGNAQPLSPEMEKLDPTLKIWLSRLGFTKDRDILRLTQYSGGSVRFGLLALTHAVRQQAGRNGGSGGQRIPRSRQQNRGAIPRETMQGVRSLLKEVQEAQVHCGEIGSHAAPQYIQGARSMNSSEGNISRNTLPKMKMQEEAQEAKFSSEELSSHDALLKSDKLDSDDFNEDLVSEDILDDALVKGSIMVEPYVPEQLAAVLRRKTEVNKLSWRKSLELMIGYQFKGHVSSYSFCIYYVLFYIHKAPPECKSFFVKAELAPPGKHHSNVYAIMADENDPGARFALRITIYDGNGEEIFFFQFSTSHTWKGIAIANPFVDTFSGDSMEMISQRKRRYLYVHERIKDISVELKPFISGAYRNDSGEVVKRVKTSKETPSDNGNWSTASG
ncbi:hypothetical protein N7493_004817 [Penicillium malachiteum]|uniref:Uncharacterized protein n=1 Tax=Penicillium malachiteum TaxID=1324776 RepID=A0AAD6MXL5_9EURO|nr:hypothetical protein N7493_004817 [Penicillium malachiteum]